MAKIVKLNSDQETHIFKEGKTAPNARKIEYIIDENTDCHECVSHEKDKDNYPRIYRGNKDLRMSRYVWSIANKKEIPKGKLVLHKCDNPKCINPEHLRLVTHKENMKDRDEKGRTLKGSSHGQSKLDETQVYFMRFEAPDIPRKLLAEIFSVSIHAINDIKNFKTWKHVTLDKVEYAMRRPLSS